MYYPPVEKNILDHLLFKMDKFRFENLTYFLVFLLPVFAVSVRHWVSSIFGLLVVTSLIFLFLRKNKKIELYKEEKILLWAFVFYFLVFIITSLVNGWENTQTRHFEVEVRFLFFVPIYLLIRQLGGSTRYLVWGSIAGIIFTAIDCVSDVIINDVKVYIGVYSQLFAGPITLILSFILLNYYYDKTTNLIVRVVITLVSLSGLYVVAETGARNAYLTAVVLYTLFAIHQFKGHKVIVVLLGTAIISYGAYKSFHTVNKRIDIAISEYQDYFKHPDPAKIEGSLTSIGTRLEMWRVTPMFFKDNPVFGVGRGNYSREVRNYIESGKVHKDIGTHGHPHNMYSEALISKGIVGLLALLVITIYPLFILLKNYIRGNRSAFYGIAVIISYLVLSMTDASTLIKGNYTAVYVTFLAVYFSCCMQEKIIKSE